MPKPKFRTTFDASDPELSQLLKDITERTHISITDVIFSLLHERRDDLIALAAGDATEIPAWLRDGLSARAMIGGGS